jgi:hypothetical protein
LLPRMQSALSRTRPSGYGDRFRRTTDSFLPSRCSVPISRSITHLFEVSSYSQVINLQGARVLMYHGRSIDDMIGLIPGASYDKSG